MQSDVHSFDQIGKDSAENASSALNLRTKFRDGTQDSNSASQSRDHNTPQNHLYKREQVTVFSSTNVLAAVRHAYAEEITDAYAGVFSQLRKSPKAIRASRAQRVLSVYPTTQDIEEVTAMRELQPWTADYDASQPLTGGARYIATIPAEILKPLSCRSHAPSSFKLAQVAHSPAHPVKDGSGHKEAGSCGEVLHLNRLCPCRCLDTYSVLEEFGVQLTADDFYQRVRPRVGVEAILTILTLFFADTRLHFRLACLRLPEVYL